MAAAMLRVMAHVNRLPLACPARLGFGWSPNGRRHFPHPGLTKSNTRKPNPAKYLPGTTPAQIQVLETATAAGPTIFIALTPFAEYVRDVGQVIGWDNG